MRIRKALVGVSTGTACVVVGVALVTPGLAQAAGAAPHVVPPRPQLQNQTNQLQNQINAQLRATPDGKQISQNQIAWRNGKVILTLPMPGERVARGPGETTVPQARPVCPRYYTCLYDLQGYGGRRVQFADCNILQELSRYGFSRKASSWYNNQTRGLQSWIYGERQRMGRRLLWTEPGAPSMSPYVGSQNDNKAEAIIACRR